MRAQINLEAVFALLTVLGACWWSFRQPASERREINSRWSWVVLLLVPAALLWTLSIPLVSDDFVHIGYALHFTPDKIAGLFTIPAGDHFFRPLGYLSYALDARWAGHSPALWHLATLLFHFANCVLVYLVGRQVGLSRFFAATAAVIFGVHGSRPETITWIACRFDLVATLFVLLTILLFLASSRRPGLYWLALVTAFLGLISKESAYVLPVMLMLVGERRWRRVAPFALLTAAVFMYRWHLLSGIGGYQTDAHTPAILNFSLVRTANALLLRLWAMLFFPVNWSEGAQWWLWMALALGVMGYGLIWASRDQRAIWFVAFTLIAALPVQQLLLIGPDLEKSRVLYLPSVGFALFLGSVLEGLRLVRWRIAAALAMISWQMACLEHNLVVWRGVALVAERACDSVAGALQGNGQTVTVVDLPNVLRGVYFFHKGMPDCLEVGHGIDIRRVREEGADMVFQWDSGNEVVKRK